MAKRETPKEEKVVGIVENKNEGPMEYNINGKTYVQKPLVLGQIKLLSNVLKGIKWPQKFDLNEIAIALTEVMSPAIAVVILEKGKETPQDIKNRNLKGMEEEFEFAVDTNLLVKVINDFLSCNPINSIWAMMEGVIMTTYMQKTPSPPNEETGSTSMSSTSPEEIS